MPSKTKAQHNLMAACSNPKGRQWAKDKDVECPPQKVAKEFVTADKRKKSGR
jgi:hypothetical protein